MAMHTVYLGLGSNIDPFENLDAGIRELKTLFGNVVLSSVYESPSVGFVGPAFLNMVARIETPLDLGALSIRLRLLEYAYGREVHAQKNASRHLDIDILAFDQYCGVFGGVVLPRPEITVNSFVLCPFAEIAPDLVLPGNKSSLAVLWAEYSDDSQQIQLLTAPVMGAEVYGAARSASL